MQTEELTSLAKKVRNSMPNVETFPMAEIYATIKEQEKTDINIADFKELISPDWLGNTVSSHT